MSKTKIESIIFERRDAVRRNVSMLIEKVEDTITDHFMEFPNSQYIRVNLYKVVKNTGFSVGQLESNLDLIYTGLLDKGWRVNLFVDEEDDKTQYLVVSV